MTNGEHLVGVEISVEGERGRGTSREMNVGGSVEVRALVAVPSRGVESSFGYRGRQQCEQQ